MERKRKNKHIKMGSVPWVTAFKENKESRFGDISVTWLRGEKQSSSSLPSRMNCFPLS
jgi:hypothetical protein